MKRMILVGILMIFLPSSAIAQPTPVEEKVGVLITAWGLSDGYEFGYAWNLVLEHAGYRTEYEGQPCRAEFSVGDFPYQSSMNIQPFHILHEVEGREYA